ncbi:MAG TPA: class I SAM-dependent methyltransferase [Terracidiphilus sp.]|nr:class I SAM-dependent methyltransferase [Terracidiphilus sp.]
MTHDRVSAIRHDYDRVASEYARRLFNELDRKPLDCQLLHRFANDVRTRGEVCDLGCGPGHVARRLHDDGVRVFGLDLSPQMIAHAQRLSPDIPFREGNMFHLDIPDGSLAGITAFYAIVNIPVALLPGAFAEISRVLVPGGLLLIAFHIGGEVLRPQEMWGQSINMEFFQFDPNEIVRLLEQAGLVLGEKIERGPHAPDVEYQTRRAFIFARKPHAAAS